MLYLFLDTNALLHFKRPDQIDWPSLAKSSPVTLIFPPVVIRELEEQKVQNHTKRIRERAQAILGWLAQFLDAKLPPLIRPNVYLHA
jgi:hypothetical protein